MSTTPSEVTAKTAGEANAVLSEVQVPPEELAAESRAIAKDAYVYAYPLLLMNAFMRQGTNYAEATGLVTQARFNQFSHAKRFHRQTTRPSSIRMSTPSIRRPTSISAPSRSCSRCRRQIATSCCRC
jgi:hypothetical protein